MFFLCLYFYERQINRSHPSHHYVQIFLAINKRHIMSPKSIYSHVQTAVHSHRVDNGDPSLTMDQTRRRQPTAQRPVTKPQFLIQPNCWPITRNLTFTENVVVPVPSRLICNRRHGRKTNRRRRRRSAFPTPRWSSPSTPFGWFELDLRRLRGWSRFLPPTHRKAFREWERTSNVTLLYDVVGRRRHLTGAPSNNENNPYNWSNK